MSEIREFIDKYFTLYLNECRVQDSFVEELFDDRQLFFPPNANELETLLLYLQKKEVDPLIIGSLAVIKYANVTIDDIRANKYRPTDKLELLVSGNLPPPPRGWKVKVNSIGQTFWISSTNGVVKFFTDKDIPVETFTLGTNPESLKYGCPVADPATLFITKLHSLSPIDLGDILLLGTLVGVPRNLDKYLTNSKQKDSLKFIRKWVRMRGKRSQ